MPRGSSLYTPVQHPYTNSYFISPKITATWEFHAVPHLPKHRAEPHTARGAHRAMTKVVLPIALQRCRTLLCCWTLNLLSSSSAKMLLISSGGCPMPIPRTFGGGSHPPSQPTAAHVTFGEQCEIMGCRTFRSHDNTVTRFGSFRLQFFETIRLQL